jgi:hypothetical protein
VIDTSGPPAGGRTPDLKSRDSKSINPRNQNLGFRNSRNPETEFGIPDSRNPDNPDSGIPGTPDLKTPGIPELRVWGTPKYPPPPPKNTLTQKGGIWGVPPKTVKKGEKRAFNRYQNWSHFCRIRLGKKTNLGVFGTPKLGGSGTLKNPDFGGV